MYKRKYKEKFPVIAICYDFDYCEPHTCDFLYSLEYLTENPATLIVGGSEDFIT